jgi:hypothetical protein
LCSLLVDVCGRRWRVRHAANNASTSSGSTILGNVRGVRTNGTPRPPRSRDRRVDRPFGTGFAVTSPRATRNENMPDSDDKRRWIVRDDRPDSPSDRRTTVGSPVARCAVMNPNTSAVVTSTGSFATVVKNTFKSNPAANTVFGRHRAARNSR